MRLLEAIIDANNRAVAGDAGAGLHPSEFADALPLAAVTCIDARLNALLPDVLGVPADKFIWLRNAGNIITGPLSSTMRSLAMACAIKGGREIAIIGHTDCLVCKTTTFKLTEAFRSMGVDRSQLPENLNEYFGLFASERQNVMKAVEIVRSSPLIGPKIPVHGLLLDVATGKLEWLVNGYQVLERATFQMPTAATAQSAKIGDTTSALPAFNLGEIKFPETKIGQTSSEIGRNVPDLKMQEINLSEIKTPTTPVVAQPVLVTQEVKPVPPGQLTAAELEMRLDKTKRYKVIGGDQKMYGPISGAKVIQWIGENRIDWQTPAQVDGSSEWKPLHQYAKSSPPPIIPLPPSIGSSGRTEKYPKRPY